MEFPTQVCLRQETCVKIRWFVGTRLTECDRRWFWGVAERPAFAGWQRPRPPGLANTSHWKYLLSHDSVSGSSKGQERHVYDDRYTGPIEHPRKPGLQTTGGIHFLGQAFMVKVEQYFFVRQNITPSSAGLEVLQLPYQALVVF